MNTPKLPETHSQASTLDRVLASENARWLAAAGAVLLTVSPFFDWFSVLLIGGLNLFSVTGSAWAWLLLLIGGSGIYISVRERNTVGGHERQGEQLRLLGAVGGCIAILILATNAASETVRLGIAQIEFGGFVAIAGSVLLFVNGLRVIRYARSFYGEVNHSKKVE